MLSEHEPKLNKTDGISSSLIRLSTPTLGCEDYRGLRALIEDLNINSLLISPFKNRKTVERQPFGISPGLRKHERFVNLLNSSGYQSLEDLQSRLGETLLNGNQLNGRF